MKTKELVALLFTVTVCIVIIGSLIFIALRGEAQPEFRAKMFDLITYIVGIVSGWLLSRKQ